MDILAFGRVSMSHDGISMQRYTKFLKTANYLTSVLLFLRRFSVLLYIQNMTE